MENLHQQEYRLTAQVWMEFLKKLVHRFRTIKTETGKVNLHRLYIRKSVFLAFLH